MVFRKMDYVSVGVLVLVWAAVAGCGQDSSTSAPSTVDGEADGTSSKSDQRDTANGTNDVSRELVFKVTGFTCGSVSGLG